MRSGQLLLTIALLATAGGLLYGTLSQGRSAKGQLEKNVAVTVPSDTQTTDEVMLLEEAPEPIPLSEFVEMTGRPLFSSSRRPPPAMENEVPLGTPQQIPASTVESSQFVVMGIVIAHDEKVALLKQLNNGNEIYHVKEGQILSDWTVSEITPESVTMRQHGTTAVVKLSDNVLSAAEKRTLAKKARQSQLNASKKQQSADGRSKINAKRLKARQSSRRKILTRQNQNKSNLRSQIRTPTR